VRTLDIMQIHCKYSKLVPVETIIPHEANANRHPEKQVKIIAKLLEYQGWRAPLVVSNLSGKLICGHGRLEAAKLLGWTEVPVDFQSFENAHQEIAHLYADNKSAALAEHDDAFMIEQIKDLDLGDMDFELLGMDDFILSVEGAQLDEVESLVGDVDKKYILEVQFPNDMEMMDIHDDLTHRGYLVKVK
jgi:hypothetical protein